MTTLGDLTEPNVDQSGPSPEGEFVYVDISSVDNRVKRIVEPKRLKASSAPSRARQRLCSGDVLVSMTRPNLNAVALVPSELDGAIGSTGFHVLRRREGVLAQWIYYGVQNRGFVDAMSELVQGALYPAVRPKDIRAFKLDAPPLEEQRRIVAEIEKQFSRLDEAVTILKRVKANLKRYKTALLKAAVEGRLVPTEAEPASRSLPRFEVADRIVGGVFAKGKSSASRPIRISKLSEARPRALPSLPAGWTCATPDQLAAQEPNSICAGPFGTIFKAKDFRPTGVPIIFLRHVAPGKYLDRKPGFMDPAKWEELFQPYSVFGGELLITKLGEPPGACAIYPTGIGPAMVTPDVIKMSVNTKISSPKYLMYYFNSEPARRYSTGAAFGTTRQRLTLPLFRAMPIPLPPLVEQTRIVDEVDRRLSFVSEVETAVDQNLERSRALRRAVLRHAFSST